MISTTHTRLQVEGRPETTEAQDKKSAYINNDYLLNVPGEKVETILGWRDISKHRL